MVKTNRKLLALVLVLLTIVGLAFWRIKTNNDRVQAQKQSELAEEAKKISVSLFIEGVTSSAQTLKINKGTTVLQLLESVDKENSSVKLKSKEYKGMGTLVETLGDKTNGTDNKYWQYSVNGVLASVGADQNVVNSGDKIEWNFKAY